MLACRIHAKDDLRIEAMDTPDVGPGQVLLRLGAGGMGSVYVVEKVATHQQYAVKFLREDHLDQRISAVNRLEATLALHGPGAAAIFGAYSCGPAVR
jgi:serine/threonine protein kinase